jgi:hypothetical protein
MVETTSKLSKGDRVRVFQMPLTDERFEGVATLVQFHDADPEAGTERWFVRFPGRILTSTRTVRAAHKINQQVVP